MKKIKLLTAIVFSVLSFSLPSLAASRPRTLLVGLSLHI